MAADWWSHSVHDGHVVADMRDLFFYFSQNALSWPILALGKLCREPQGWLTANYAFTVYIVAVRALPTAAHGKQFTESEPAFAMRNRLMTKLAFPVVLVFRTFYWLILFLWCTKTHNRQRAIYHAHKSSSCCEKCYCKSEYLIEIFL